MKQRFKVPCEPVSKNGDRSRYIKYKAGDERRKPHWNAKKNKYVQSDGFISHYLAAEVIAYANTVKQYILAQHPKKYYGAVAVHIFVNVKTPVSMTGSRLKMTEPNMLDEDETRLIMPTAKPDPDNLLKNILDAIKLYVMVDDSYICDLSIRKRYGDEDYVIIEVEQIGIPCQLSLKGVGEFVEGLK